ncbi:hypothetical protein DdX_15760 [Ditylenchus destructor]|uniref:Uncharacterized protein n=1 Tax=Ditylenchus destructor TaxID=166010 RepID=A0AAD4R0I8_9BILA|nr:hypothetical protein DdX_15760 [Ditylenchus destructor]
MSLSKRQELPITPKTFIFESFVDPAVFGGIYVRITENSGDSTYTNIVNLYKPEIITHHIYNLLINNIKGDMKTVSYPSGRHTIMLSTNAHGNKLEIQEIPTRGRRQKIMVPVGEPPYHMGRSFLLSHMDVLKAAKDESMVDRRLQTDQEIPVGHFDAAREMGAGELQAGELQAGELQAGELQAGEGDGGDGQFGDGGDSQFGDGGADVPEDDRPSHTSIEYEGTVMQACDQPEGELAAVGVGIVGGSGQEGEHEGSVAGEADLEREWRLLGEGEKGVMGSMGSRAGSSFFRKGNTVAAKLLKKCDN